MTSHEEIKRHGIHLKKLIFSQEKKEKKSDFDIGATPH